MTSPVWVGGWPRGPALYCPAVPRQQQPGESSGKWCAAVRFALKCQHGGSVRPGSHERTRFPDPHGGRVPCRRRGQGLAPRLREIPLQLHLVPDREIVIRLLGARAWEVLNRLRQERRTGRSARMLFAEVLGDVWVVQRNPILETTCSTTRSAAPRCRALHHRLGAIGRAARQEDGAARCAVGELLTAARSAVDASERPVRQDGRAAPPRTRRARPRVTAKAQHRLRRPRAVTRHRRPDWRVSTPSSCSSGHRRPVGHLVKAASSSATIIPAAAAPGFYRRRHSAVTTRPRVINTKAGTTVGV